MSVTNLLEKAIFHINQATEEDKKGNYEKALKLYVMSFEYLVFANKCIYIIQPSSILFNSYSSFFQ